MISSAPHLELLVEVYRAASSCPFNTCDTCGNPAPVLYSDLCLGNVPLVCLWCLLHIVERNDEGLRWIA